MSFAKEFDVLHFQFPLDSTKLSPSRHFRVSLLFFPQVMSIKTAEYLLPKESEGSLCDKFINKCPFYNMAS
jgi:hypothetical protein